MFDYESCTHTKATKLSFVVMQEWHFWLKIWSRHSPQLHKRNPHQIFSKSGVVIIEREYLCDKRANKTEDFSYHPLHSSVEW